MIIDHISFKVSDAAASKLFFTQVLAPLGIEPVKEFEEWTGFGVGDKAEFWFGPGDPILAPMHVAFLAETREQVRAFHKAALAAGATDNGAPGLREHFHPHYFGAFVIGPDGHNIEAVCHKPHA